MKKLLPLLLLLIIPIAAAQLEITEVMYNPTGSDTGREWIEIYNSGEQIDLTGWKWVEGTSNHNFPSTTIPANTYAVIVNTEDKFKQDYSSYSGIIIDSTISGLTNTNGKQLSLKSPDGTLLSPITYPTSAKEGNTVCKLTDWQECSPTPGAANQAASAPPVEDKTDTKTITIEEDSDTQDNEEETPKEETNKILIAILEASSEVEQGKEFGTKIKIKNVFSESKTIELTSYIFEGSSVKTEGSWSGNKQDLTLKAGEEKELTLTNKVKADAVTGTYKLRVRAKIGTKTYDKDQEIKIIEKTTEAVEEPKEEITSSSIEEPESLLNEAPVKATEASTEPKTIYINKETGSLNKAALIFIIVLVIAVVFLVISLRK